ncbi:MAG: FecR domain-containing protein [Alphaproteobacteria bacterium]
MAYKDLGDFAPGETTQKTQTVLNGDADTVQLPDASFVRDADFTRDGMDLVLNGPEGTLVINDYFADEAQPNLVAPDGSALTPDLVNSFLKSSPEYAANDTQTDESPVGAVQEVSGHATVTHADGSVETIVNGTEIYKGDIIETDAAGAVNIKFADETSFAVSEGARLAIDEYVYDPATESGSTNFSVLKGVFVFTSGLIGRDDPDDVKIDTPVGSIGIRGTIIAGNVNTGEITVVEGAIVLKDHSGHEVTLATQFETARFGGNDGIEHMGKLSAQDVAHKFFVVSQVSPTLFSSINDAAAEQPADEAAQPTTDTEEESAPAETAPATETEGHNATSEETATQTAAFPPVPPPVATQTVSGFSTSSSSGLTSGMTEGTHEPMASVSGQNALIIQTVINTTAAASTVNTAPPPPTVNDPQPPAGGGGATNNAPHHNPEAPNEFFKSSEGQQWHYRFDKEFLDDGGQSNLTYELSANTQTALNAWVGNIINGGSTWSFNAATGDLVVNFSASSPTAAGSTSTLTVEVQAIDSAGAVSGYQDFDLVAYNAHANTLGALHTTSNQVISTTGAANSQIQGSSNTVFLGGSPDNVTLNTGSGNMVNLGHGNNIAAVDIGARNNMIVGGDNYDRITLFNGAMKIFGMDGNDDFMLKLGGGSSVLGDLTTAGSGLVIDGGHSNFRAGVAIGQPFGEAGGRGDSLVLEENGTLDFSMIHSANQIGSIERLDMLNAGVQTVALNYNDILRITDDKNALVINVGAGDTLNLSGMSGMTKTNNDVVVDDGATTVQNRTYDVYSDGTVTLFIHADAGGTVNGVSFDGTP